MSWAEDQAKKIADANERTQRERAYQIHSANVVKEKGPLAFEALCDTIQRLVGEFNKIAQPPQPLEYNRQSERTVFITKSGTPPQGSVQLTFFPDRIAIKNRIVHNYENTRDWPGIIQFSVPNGQDVVLLDGAIDTEPIAGRILETLTDLYH